MRDRGLHRYRIPRWVRYHFLKSPRPPSPEERQVLELAQYRPEVTAHLLHWTLYDVLLVEERLRHRMRKEKRIQNRLACALNYARRSRGPSPPKPQWPDLELYLPETPRSSLAGVFDTAFPRRSSSRVLVVRGAEFHE